MGDYYGFSEETHRRAERIISNEIRHCASALVDSILPLDNANLGTWDDVVNLNPTFETTAGDWHLVDEGTLDTVFECECPHCGETVRQAFTYAPDPDLEDESIATCQAAYDEFIEECISECIEESWQMHECAPRDIFEWWLVTDWLADKLEESGEPVFRAPWGSCWGRTCTGQAIILDGTIQRIVESINENIERIVGNS